MAEKYGTQVVQTLITNVPVILLFACAVVGTGAPLKNLIT